VRNALKAVAACVASIVLGVDLAQAAADTRGEPASCGPMRQVDTAEGLMDYRLKDVSASVKKGVRDLDTYHTRPALELMRTGSLYRSVKADLDFSLRYSPNHHGALRALLQYERASGKAHDFPATECYFTWAQEFMPDDTDVWLMSGYLLWSKKDFTGAEAAYQRALTLKPDSADAHYNIGLLYAELRKFEQALEHAHAAYKAGYPLPGLRQKLERAGKWREPSAQAAD
jgi:tetratricopeptide (TPR) repeat protein